MSFADRKVGLVGQSSELAVRCNLLFWIPIILTTLEERKAASLELEVEHSYHDSNSFISSSAASCILARHPGQSLARTT